MISEKALFSCGIIVSSENMTANEKTPTFRQDVGCHKTTQVIWTCYIYYTCFFYLMQVVLKKFTNKLRKRLFLWANSHQNTLHLRYVLSDRLITSGGITPKNFTKQAVVYINLHLWQALTLPNVFAEFQTTTLAIFR